MGVERSKFDGISHVAMCCSLGPKLGSYLKMENAAERLSIRAAIAFVPVTVRGPALWPAYASVGTGNVHQWLVFVASMSVDPDTMAFLHKINRFDILEAPMRPRAGIGEARPNHTASSRHRRFVFYSDSDITHGPLHGPPHCLIRVKHRCNFLIRSDNRVCQVRSVRFGSAPRCNMSGNAPRGGKQGGARWPSHNFNHTYDYLYANPRC